MFGTRQGSLILAFSGKGNQCHHYLLGLVLARGLALGSKQHAYIMDTPLNSMNSFHMAVDWYWVCVLSLSICLLSPAGLQLKAIASFKEASLQLL
jgi:hypothetical protein